MKKTPFEIDSKAFRELIEIRSNIVNNSISEITEIASICSKALAAGRKILFCGNGGSAADAQHLAAELLVRFKPELSRRPLPGIALTMDTSTITACANDLGFELLYERAVNAFGEAGDVFIAITTSGNSVNVNKALIAASQKGLTTIGFLGGEGGSAKELCEYKVIVPSHDIARIQEIHITLGHCVIEIIEEYIFKSTNSYNADSI
jgi:D-sedoheptulose 7-phosphate isomerase